jgi:hypothetical protein
MANKYKFPENIATPGENNCLTWSDPKDRKVTEFVQEWEKYNRYGSKSPLRVRTIIQYKKDLRDRGYDLQMHLNATFHKRNLASFFVDIWRIGDQEAGVRTKLIYSSRVEFY